MSSTTDTHGIVWHILPEDEGQSVEYAWARAGDRIMNTTDTIAVLGAPDPEMSRIEALLGEAGIPVLYAVRADGGRVRGGDAYACAPIRVPDDHGDGGNAPVTMVVLVECDPPLPGFQHDDPYMGGVVRIDHHRPGDPGYGRPPQDYWAASSIGQVVALLAREGRRPRWYDDAEIPRDLLLAAASDHCPAAAYQGRCLGVGPDDLMEWRAETRAAFQERSVEDILHDVEAAMESIMAAPEVLVGDVHCSDLRREGHVPEAPEASLRLGIPILAEGLPDRDTGRRKVVLLGDHTGDAVRAFLGGWAAKEGLVDLYGDPARGFAGGYVPA